MSQVLEITKHSNKYLIHHFEFECKDGKIFGNFTGNCTLNKFMSLHDWHQIFDSLSVPIQQYIESPMKRPPTPMQQQIGNTNFELNIAWAKMDADIYSKLFTSIDFNLVLPYVIKVAVSLRSNIDKFIDVVDEPIESPAAISDGGRSTALASNRKRTPKRKNSGHSPRSPASQPSAPITNGIAHKPIKLRECCVRLPLLKFDENGQVIQQTNGERNNKRKYSAIANNQKGNPNKMTPIRNGRGENGGADDTHEFKFKCSSSSTPFVRNNATENGGSGINIGSDGSAKPSRRITASRMTMSTPLSSQGHKMGSTQFNPRIRLLKMPENVNKLNVSVKKSKRKDRCVDKKSKNALGKRIIKKKIRSIPNESQLFETPPQKRKEKKTAALVSGDGDENGADATTEKVDNNGSQVMSVTPVTPCSSADIVKIENLDLKSLTEQELKESYDDNFGMISNLFLNYLKQTDASVRGAGDYTPFEIISLVTPQQFSVMLDILFDRMVKIGEFGEINYEALFFESIIPEWLLAIFMQRNSFDRKTAIETLATQKLQSDQNQEQYTSLINVRLDDTVNLTKM